jgi:hypothetical protein
MRTLLPLLLVSCATTTASAPKGGPRGLRASEHLQAANEHDEAARTTTQWPDTTSERAPYNIPWTRGWNTAAEEERFAAFHRGQANALQLAYEEACGQRPLAQVSVSPLQRFGIGGWNTTSGVILYLSTDAGQPDQLIADMKCHRAWMMLAPSGMEDCPLDLPGIEVDAHGDTEGISVSIMIRDPKLVDELQRRAGHELELAASARQAH